MSKNPQSHTKEFHFSRLSSRHHLPHHYNNRHHTTSITMPSSVSKRSKADFFMRSGVSEGLTQQNMYPRYSGGGGSSYSAYPHQNVMMSRERMLKRTLSLIMLSLLSAFVTYIWLSQTDRPHQFSSYYDLPNRHHHQSKDSRSYPITPSTPSFHEQIHLYRILGNDLPPRHNPGQVLKNLVFILENEPAFPNTKKWWLLNRIVDPDYEEAILELLRSHQQEYVRIPFQVDEYFKRDFRLEDFPEPDFFHSYDYANFSKVAKLRTIDYTYCDKNIYAMNNNGGRNAALKHGKSQPNARWIMPFDGNCFLTTNGFKEIISQIETWGDDYKYFLVPMKRLLNNTELLLEMLWRLGVPTPRRMLNKPSVPWESQDAPYLAPPKDKYKTVGWIFRLFSGRASLEESGTLRAFNRLIAIQDFLDGIDERIARVNQGFDPNRLSLYEERNLNRARIDYWSGRKDIQKIVDAMVDRANNIVSTISDWYKLNDALPSDSSTQVKFLGVDGDTDSRDKKSNLKLIKKVKTMKPLLANKGSLSEEFHQDEFGQYISTAPTELPDFSTSLLFENVTVLTFAHYFSGNVLYSHWAANLVRTFVLSSYGIYEQDELETTSHKNDQENTRNEGYGFPHLNKIPRAIPKFTLKKNVGNGNSSMFPYDLIETDPSYFLDACRLLYQAKSLTHKEYIELQQFASLWLEYLVNSWEGVERAHQPDHRSTFYDLQVLSLSGFTNDVRLYLRVSNRIRMRIRKQFNLSNDASLISQPYETKYIEDHDDLENSGAISRTAMYENEKFRYSSLNLQYWMLITRLIQNVGIGHDLWSYKAKGLKLSKIVMEHMNRYSNRKTMLDYFNSNVNINHDYDGNLGEAENRVNAKNEISASRTRLIENDAHILKPLIYIAQAAHESNDRRLKIKHEHGDEHDYFQQYMDNYSDKMELTEGGSGSAENRDEWRKLDNILGIGRESRERGIPPFWMLGVA
ncbi:2491_t:CDS:2 [Acaulospora colombiana]|uniref:2491_t:CDS:1 n=1 Tax=Acaulospora colombiana TaxID=27376 RepID=A0ACA9KEK8_9GLOM|nr:2491_t:CDS:2 [Acaulospora colombiana]